MAEASLSVCVKAADVAMPDGRLCLLIESWAGDRLLSVSIFDPCFSEVED